MAGVTTVDAVGFPGHDQVGRDQQSDLHEAFVLPPEGVEN